MRPHKLYQPRCYFNTSSNIMRTFITRTFSHNFLYRLMVWVQWATEDIDRPSAIMSHIQRQCNECIIQCTDLKCTSARLSHLADQTSQLALQWWCQSSNLTSIRISSPSIRTYRGSRQQVQNCLQCMSQWPSWRKKKTCHWCLKWTAQRFRPHHRLGYRQEVQSKFRA